MLSHTERDPSWLATRYVLGELSDAETSAFEQRLLDDQGAREAVAAAVELVGAVAIVGRDQPLVLPKSHPRPGRFVAWATLGLAAAVLIAALGWLGDGPVSESETTPVGSAWLGLRELPGVEIEAEVDPLDPEMAILASPVEGEPAFDRPLPSWLVAGAAGPTEDSPRAED